MSQRANSAVMLMATRLKTAFLILGLAWDPHISDGRRTGSANYSLIFIVQPWCTTVGGMEMGVMQDDAGPTIHPPNPGQMQSKMGGRVCRRSPPKHGSDEKGRDGWRPSTLEELPRQLDQPSGQDKK